jgi:hypothetical protein
VTAAVLDRYPFNSPWVRSVVARFWLPAWFAMNSLAGVAHAARDTSLLYFDARLYLDATRAWLDGGDPWAVQLAGNYFAAPPPTLLPLAPIALLPIDLGVAFVASAVILGAVATVRMLGLPWWWILFPPLVQCILSGNVQSLLLPLVLAGGGALAAFLKVYAGVPLVILGRWRAVLVAGVVFIGTLPVLPWAEYLAQLPTITERLDAQSKYGLPTLVLVAAAPVALLAMWIVGRERAAWLAVPALWPSQQYYYGTFVLGAKSKIAAAVTAFPVPGSGLLALLVLAVLTKRTAARSHPERDRT